ncbi:MAG: hypothetical protein JXQ97_14635 [Natronospirillum sp.]
MAQIINTNLASLTAQRNLTTSQSANETALQRLSSGLRINSAKDDAAGLAISTRFESQTKGLGVAIRNAGDGISLAQTAEGALQSMTDALQRIRELAVQSANGTNSDDDRVALQSEVNQLIAEITRTSEETTFNGRTLFDGEFNGIFQVGANAGQTVAVSIGELTAAKLGASDQVGVSAFGTDEALANGDLTINGVGIDASRAGDDTASTTNAAASAIAKVEAINRKSDETGVRAFVNDNVAAGSAMTGAATTGNITLNGVEIEISTSSDTNASRASVVQAINSFAEQTGIRAVDTGSSANGVQLIAEDGRNIDLQFTGVDGDPTAASTGLGEAKTYYGGYTLIADGAVKEITITGGNGTGRGDLANAGLTAGTYTRSVASGVSEVQSKTFVEGSLNNDGTLFNSALGTAAAATFADATQTYTFSVNVGGDSVFSAPLAGSTEQGNAVAAIANSISANANGVVAWEEVSATITVGTFDSADSIVFNGTAGASVGIVATATTAAENAKLTAQAINETDFGADLQVTAAANDDGTISLTIKNFAEEAVKLTKDGTVGTLTVSVLDGTTPGTDVALTGSIDTTVIGSLQFSNLDGKNTSISISSDLDGTASTLLLGNGSTDTSFTASYEAPKGLTDGDLVINGVGIGSARVAADTASATTASDGGKIWSSIKEQSAIAVAAAINAVSGETGVSASVNATQVVGGTGESFNANDTELAVGDQAGLYINGVEIGVVTLQADSGGLIDADRARADALNLINQNSGKTGVVATDNGVSLTLTAADGRNISIAIDNQSGTSESMGAVFGLEGDGIGEAAFGTESIDGRISAEGVTYETTYGTVTLESAGKFTLEGGSNGTAALEALGLKVGTFGGGEDGQFLKDIDISTFEGATAAITAVDNALRAVTSTRADLGAIQNRFESTISNLQITSENLTAANSRIRDADFASESAELSRTQVLQQAGISILAQANQRPQQVLSLLG